MCVCVCVCVCVCPTWFSTAESKLSWLERKSGSESSCCWWLSKWPVRLSKWPVRLVLQCCGAYYIQYGPNTVASLFVNFDSLHNPLSPACVMLCVLTLTSVAELQCKSVAIRTHTPKSNLSMQMLRHPLLITPQALYLYINVPTYYMDAPELLTLDIHS